MPEPWSLWVRSGSFKKEVHVVEERKNMLVNTKGKWKPPLMDEDWVVLCQALYQSLGEQEWIEMHTKLKRSVQNDWSKESGQKVA